VSWRSVFSAKLAAMIRLLSLVLLLGGGCAALGGVDDGTSLSEGGSNRGALLNAVELPVRGDGYLIPPTWASRGLNFGTEELVGIIVRAARRVDRERPGATLYVADLSPRRGGASAWHRSHQSGRDADLHFYALDVAGRPAGVPSVMPRFDGLGVAAGRVFDVERNWLLVRAILEDPVSDVQYLFISAPLRQRLLDHATASGEPPELVARAAAVLAQPADSLPHDDHLHLRIYCPAGDRSLGCKDRGPQRWLKKTWKYATTQRLPATSPTATLDALPAIGPMCRLVPTSVVAAR
jgi:penicillin-insensitive murein endopeptidase